MKNGEDFDVIVVGSGASGGWAAKEFCEAGLKVLVIDRGEPTTHKESYTNEFVEPWDRPFGNQALPGERKKEYGLNSAFVSNSSSGRNSSGYFCFAYCLTSTSDTCWAHKSAPNKHMIIRKPFKVFFILKFSYKFHDCLPILE